MIDDGEEFARELGEMKRKYPDAYLSTIAFICVLAHDGDVSYWATGFSKGTYKRAIKLLREGQREFPEYADTYDDAVALIRREWLHREEASA